MLGDQDTFASSLLSFVSQVTTSVFTLSQKFPSKCLSLSLHDIIVSIIEQGFSCLQFDMLAEVFHHKLQTALLLCSVTMTMAYVHIYYWGALVSPLRKASESSLIFWRPWGLRVSHVFCPDHTVISQVLVDTQRCSHLSSVSSRQVVIFFVYCLF